MGDVYKENFYTDEMIATMGGVANVDRFVKCQKKLDRRTNTKNFLRIMIVSVIKLVLICGIIVLLFKIFI